VLSVLVVKTDKKYYNFSNAKMSTEVLYAFHRFGRSSLTNVFVVILSAYRLAILTFWKMKKWGRVWRLSPTGPRFHNCMSRENL